LKLHELRRRRRKPGAGQAALRATRRLPAAFLLSMIVLSGSVIVFHDYLCHEHGHDLHEICGPLHAAFVNSEPFAAEESLGSQPPGFLSPLAADGSPLSGFIEDIFHPPDLSV
jgi:hypothetical protein